MLRWTPQPQRLHRPRQRRARRPLRFLPSPSLSSAAPLRVGIEAESDGLNPAANNFAVSAYIMTYPIFDPLTYYDKQGNWVPVLAESWTKIGDGTNWHMKLREGIRFHDGTELEADDVVATFEAQLADPVISLAFKPGFDPDEPFRKIDDYTVEYRGVRPSARLPIYFASQLGMILPSEWIERALADPSLNPDARRHRSVHDREPGPGREDRAGSQPRLLGGRHNGHLPREYRDPSDHRHRHRCGAAGRGGPRPDSHGQRRSHPHAARSCGPRGGDLREPAPPRSRSRSSTRRNRRSTTSGPARP